MGFTVMMLVGSGSAIAEGGGADGGGTGGGGAGSGNGCTLSSIVCHQKHTGKHTWRGGGDWPRLALLDPMRVVPRAPKLPSIRQQGPLACSGLFVGLGQTAVGDPK